MNRIPARREEKLLGLTSSPRSRGAAEGCAATPVGDESFKVTLDLPSDSTREVLVPSRHTESSGGRRTSLGDRYNTLEPKASCRTSLRNWSNKYNSSDREAKKRSSVGPARSQEARPYLTNALTAKSRQCPSSLLPSCPLSDYGTAIHPTCTHSHLVATFCSTLRETAHCTRARMQPHEVLKHEAKRFLLLLHLLRQAAT